MERIFYKSLDRQFEILGLRGAWVKKFLVFAGCSFGAGIVFGFGLGTGIGLVTAIIGIVGSFFACLTLQAKTPGPRLEKENLSSKCKGAVIRRETLARILLDDEGYIAEKKKEKK